MMFLLGPQCDFRAVVKGAWGCRPLEKALPANHASYWQILCCCAAVERFCALTNGCMCNDLSS